MSTDAPKRATIYLDASLHRALRMKSAAAGCSISEVVENAVRESLREDHDDLAAFEERTGEKSVSYEQLLKKLKADGTL